MSIHMTKLNKTDKRRNDFPRILSRYFPYLNVVRGKKNAFQAVSHSEHWS